MMSRADQHYCGTREKDGGWVGVVYHYDPTGNKEIRDHTSKVYYEQDKAMDAAVEWAGDHNVDVEME